MGLIWLLFSVTGIVLTAACWAIYQLILQNGKTQLQLQALEKRLAAQGVLSAEPDAISSGLPLRSALHDFELPKLSGGTMTLSEWRGRKLLLIFFTPACPHCVELLPELAALPAGEGERPQPILISTGDADENRRLFESHRMPHPVLLQSGTELTSLYWVNASPSAYLVDEQGLTASVLLRGGPAVLNAARQGAIAATPLPGRGRVSRSLEDSQITRDGLKAGAAAPDFSLPLATGGTLTLREYRGTKVLLVFSDPACAPCQELAPKLEELHRSSKGLRVLMVSRGDAEANRAKIREHGITFPVALQRYWEISRSYGIFATPVAYAINEEGMLAAEVAVGSGAILSLAGKASSSGKRKSMLATG